jgi:hypothetical protein
MHLNITIVPVLMSHQEVSVNHHFMQQRGQRYSGQISLRKIARCWVLVIEPPETVLKSRQVLPIALRQPTSPTASL